MFREENQCPLKKGSPSEREQVFVNNDTEVLPFKGTGKRDTTSIFHQFYNLRTPWCERVPAPNTINVQLSAPIVEPRTQRTGVKQCSIISFPISIWSDESLSLSLSVLLRNKRERKTMGKKTLLEKSESRILWNIIWNIIFP